MAPDDADRHAESRLDLLAFLGLEIITRIHQLHPDASKCLGSVIVQLVQRRLAMTTRRFDSELPSIIALVPAVQRVAPPRVFEHGFAERAERVLEIAAAIEERGRVIDMKLWIFRVRPELLQQAERGVDPLPRRL